jgi:hypothetical protein
MKIYTGHKTRRISPYVVIKEDKRTRDLWRYVTEVAPPAHFQWGFRCKGSECLAMSLLHDATGCRCGWEQYYRIFVTALEDTWQLTEEQIVQASIKIRRQDGHEDDCIKHPLYKNQPKGGSR